MKSVCAAKIVDLRQIYDRRLIVGKYNESMLLRLLSSYYDSKVLIWDEDDDFYVLHSIYASMSPTK